MRLTRLRIALLAVAVGIAVGIAWWRTSLQPAPVLPRADTPETMRPSVTPPSETAGTAPRAMASRPAVALPPRDTPIDRLWSTLEASAKAGDAGAACRLAIETIRCTGALRFAEALAPPVAAADRGELQALLDFERDPQSLATDAPDEDPQFRAALDQSIPRAQAAARRCEGTTPERLAQARSLLRAAALRGQPDAQAIYAAGEAWFLAEPGAMGSPEFDQWRREAPLIVARMLDAGHPEAPGLLAGAYSGQTWLSGLYERDLERAAAFLILSTRLMGKPELAERELRRLDAGARTRARHQADALYSRHYAGRQTAKASYWLGAGIRIAHADYGGDGNRPAPCASPAAVAVVKPLGTTAAKTP